MSQLLATSILSVAGTALIFKKLWRNWEAGKEHCIREVLYKLAQLPGPLSGIELGCIVDGTAIQYCKKNKKSLWEWYF